VTEIATTIFYWFALANFAAMYVGLIWVIYRTLTMDTRPWHEREADARAAARKHDGGP
jgi:hypothetical protein